MATYKEIQDDIRRQHKRTVKPCWIAHVKELNGLPMRQAPNRHAFTHRANPCPNNVRPLIEASMRPFGMM